MWKIKWRLACAVIAFMATPVGADDFALLLNRVWTTHPDILQAQANLQAAGYDVVGAYAGFLPYAQLSLAQNRGQDVTTKQDYEAQFVLPLWRGGLNFATLSQAKASELLARSEVARQQLRLGLRLIDAHFTVVAAAQQAEQWEKYNQVLGQLRGLIERRAAAGMSPDADVQTILTRIAQAQSQAAFNEASWQAALAQQEALVGAVVESGEWPRDTDLLTEADVVAVPERAKAGHPELIYGQATVTREQANVRSARARLSPEISLRYNKPFGDLADRNSPSTQINFQYQTDNGLRALQSWRSSQQRLRAAQIALDTTQREILSAVGVATSEWQTARFQLDNQQRAVDAAEAVVSSSLRQFDGGRKTWLEVLNSQREAHETRLQRIQQYRSLWAANAKLLLQGLYWDRLQPANTANTAVSEVQLPQTHITVNPNAGEMP